MKTVCSRCLAEFPQGSQGPIEELRVHAVEAHGVQCPTVSDEEMSYVVAQLPAMARYLRSRYSSGEKVNIESLRMAFPLGNAALREALQALGYR